VGWLGPGRGDEHVIQIANKKMNSFSSVVTANIVLDILREDDKKDTTIKD